MKSYANSYIFIQENAFENVVCIKQNEPVVIELNVHVSSLFEVMVPTIRVVDT